ncbi:GYD domain-containing protein [Halomicroarcula sp. F13]|uniref:GYD domain-containing protein n=1 Tax=Haloarcula rubra TaxID=2487747 RepID=A0AAW4PV62_9EURY|nr:GYD domain-containing protein [Halomicroarcula rubra]MBX0324390.1 GYD domain-containing protein [Halomicroarcula rubra]
MPTYVVLFEKTDEGRTINPEEAQERRQRGVEMVEEVGGEVTALYYGSGRYDIVGIADLPDGEALGKVQTAYESLGLTAIEAWEVFEPAEWNEILEEAPM